MLLNANCDLDDADSKQRLSLQGCRCQQNSPREEVDAIADTFHLVGPGERRSASFSGTLQAITMPENAIYRGNENNRPANGKSGNSENAATLPMRRRFPTPEFLDRVRPGIVDLLTSFDCAHSVRCDVWDFALEIYRLRKSGLADNDLRWLILKKYVDHACEVTRKEDDGRQFRRTGNLCFAKRTCFVLTTAGATFARSGLREELSNSSVCSVTADGRHSNRKNQTFPTWDADRRELRFGGRVVKQFKWPAENQERILKSFQEEGWPHRIDDPIPPKPDQSQRQRLRDAISSLNRNQESRLIRFRSDGSGRGVVWELVLGASDRDR